MKIIDQKGQITESLSKERQLGKSVGLVPTMGALHEGHLDLVRAAISENDITVCSIFINPTQFNNPEDLEKYPRSRDADLAKLKINGCDYVYIPDVADLYPKPLEEYLKLDFGKPASILEGKFRPGHFNGVALVVSKLLNIVSPDRAYFGQKDLQQFFIIQRLIDSLSYPVELRCIPTRREHDGLAMSSRNLRIEKEFRPIANTFYIALNEGLTMLKNKESISAIREYISLKINSISGLKLEYFDIINTEDFSIEEHNFIKGKTALVIAGYLNNIRLIDNVLYI